MTMYFGMSVDDVALSGWSKPANFASLIRFFDDEKVPATFFVVPLDEESGKTFAQLPGNYADLIKSAHSRGYEFAQHGLRHNRFEYGVPPQMILDLPHETESKRYAEENRAKLAAEQTCENLRPRLRQGREILENELGFSMSGFRAPALQESPGMFEALAVEGYRYDSSACLQETGWDYIMNRMDVEPRVITRERYLELRKKAAIPILPLTTDYTWYLTAEKYDRVWAMAQQDFRACCRVGIPFVTVCHVDPVFEGEGIRFLHEFFAWACEEALRQNLDLEFATLEQIATKVK